MKDGFLFIDKQVDWTSRDICNKASHLLNIKKVGHSGTLDPFATGLLILAFGNASKAIPYLEELDKTYIAELFLGKKTNTADLTGEVIEEKEIPSLDKDKIKEVFTSFIGKQTQIPPMTSAIHVNGQKLYELAHKGIEIERKARNIEVFELNLISFEDNKVIFSARVSKGTYLRTLGEDIAERLGTVGHLTALRRVKIHNYSITSAKTIDQINEEDLISIEKILSQVMDEVFVDETKSSKIKNGVSFTKNEFPPTKSENVFLVDAKTKEALAIYHFDGEKYVCLRGLWS